MGVLILFAVSVASCRYNELEPDMSSGKNNGKGRISFVLGNASSEVLQTKGVAVSANSGVKELLTVTDTDSLFLIASVVENNDRVFPALSAGTKGSPVTSDNIGEFYVTAFLSPEVKYMENVALTDDDKDVVNDVAYYTLDYYWPKETLDFFASNFLIAKGSSSLGNLDEVVANPNWTKAASVEPYTQSTGIYGYDEDGTCMGQFAYSLPDPDPTLMRDAENQPDYVVAIADGMSEDTNDGVVPLDFAHCFTAVVFKIGNEFLNPEGRQVREISVSDVASSGVCTYRVSNTGAIAFDWDTEGAQTATYRQLIDYDGTQTNVGNGETVNDGELTFMLIPHTLSEDASIRITFAMHETLDDQYHHEVVVEKKIRELFPDIVEKKWLPGKKYIYTIASEEKVNVTVTDQFVSTSPMIKGNLEITNEGTAVSYVRAMIVGWWENTSGVVVAPWNESEGEFTGTGWGNDRSWVKADDGFYYYMNALSPGDSTDKLFDTYELTAAPPVVDARLVLTVVTQGVVHYRAAEAWPVQIPGATINGFTQDNGGSYW